MSKRVSDAIINKLLLLTSKEYIILLVYYCNFSISNPIETMVVDESVDTSNDASLVDVNESLEPRLFPIFTNQTPPSSHLIWYLI